MDDDHDTPLDGDGAFRPSGRGILELLDAPETDDGVVAEARFYGAPGCDELVKAVRRRGALDDTRRARAIHLLGWLECEDFLPIADDMLKRGPLGVQASTAYALVRIDRSTAESELLPIIEDENADSLLREHAVTALWGDADQDQRASIAKAVRSSEDERLRTELARLIGPVVTVNDAGQQRSDDPTD